MSDSRMAFFHRLLVSWGFISFSSSCITRSHRFSSRNGRREGIHARARKRKRWNTNRNRDSLFHRVLSYYTRAFDQRSRRKYSGKQLKHVARASIIKYFPIFGYIPMGNCFFFSHLWIPLRAFFNFRTIARKFLYTRNCFAIVSSLIITKLSLRKLLFNPWTLNMKSHISLRCDF